MSKLRLRFEVMKAKTRNIAAFWHVTPFSLVEIFHHFGGNTRLHF